MPDVADSNAVVEARNVTRPCQTTQDVLYAGISDRRTLATYVYDDRGRAQQDVITDTTFAFEQIDYTWDGAGHLVRKDDLVEPPPSSFVGITENVEELTYDTPGRLLSDTTIDMFAVRSDEPAPSDAFTYGGFDELGRPAQADEIQRVVVANDTTIPAATIHTVHSYSYDDLGRRTGRQVVDDTGAMVAWWTTVYDDAALTETTTAVIPGVSTVTTSYTFDASYNLAAWTVTTLGADGNPSPLAPPVAGTERFDGDRETSADYLLAPPEEVLESVRYGCSVDQLAQQNLDGQAAIANLPAVPIDPPSQLK